MAVRYPLCPAAALTLLLCACHGAADTAPRPKKEPPTKARVFEAKPEPLTRASFELSPLRIRPEVAWVALGGGSDPLSNQVSLAQDLEILRGLMPGAGVLLFASGPGAKMAVSSPMPDRGQLRTLLAELFGAPGAVATSYVEARFPIDGPATAEQARAVLRQALAPGTEPLLVYAACHGEGGATPRDSSLSLWGGWSFGVGDLVQVLDEIATPRPAQFVITSCFGGGFADLIFKRGGELRGAEQCGVFAAPWDHEASGCDPNPDRRAQESYALHLLAALRGQDRGGQEARARIDLDGDGQIGLLEAHTFARIAAHSLDMPTTTSERYLRELTAHEAQSGKRAHAGQAALAESREEAAVIVALGGELELSDESTTLAKSQELDAILSELAGEVEKAQELEEDAFLALRIALLELWPLLDHPWEARTDQVLRQHGAAISNLLLESEVADAHRKAQAELDDLLEQQDRARVAHARVARLLRAHETLRLTQTLAARGGEAWERYRALRACERRAPITRSTAP